MKDSLRLSLSQKLRQRLSPSQMKFVRLLEMNTPEIEEEVRHEVEENPAIEIVDSDRRDDAGEDADFNESAEEMMRADYRDDDDIPVYNCSASNRSADDPWYEPVAVASPMSLLEYLNAQISQMSVAPDEEAAAEYIIGNIDSNGYLTRPLRSIADDVAITTGVDIPYETFQRGLALVRSLDPAGVGANDLRDCLLLQLDRMTQSPDTALAREIVADYFDLFSLKHYDRLATALGVSTDDLRRADDIIRSLNPKPGADIGGDPAEDRARHIIPDFIVETDDENITVTLTDSVPELQIERTFSSDPADSEARAFISRRREEAIDFIDMLRLRHETLFNVMSAIVSIQRRFFLTDDESELRPMVLKDVAAITGYDLSVISRATTGKYAATASGVYPLKFFFNEGVSATDGDDDASTQACLAAIRSMIEDEDPSAPLSDEAIAAGLAEKGIEIARRTVAKYRQRLGLPVARLRRKL